MGFFLAVRGYAVSYRIEVNETLEASVKRAAEEQVGKALTRLESAGKSEREEAIHDARKAIKKVRALLRLARGELGKRSYKRENRRFRNAGRYLSDLRDVQVMVNMLDTLQRHFDDQLYAKAFKNVRSELLKRQEAAEKALEDGDTIEKAVTLLAEAKGEIKGWTFKRQRERLPKGVVSAYREGLEAFEQAYAEPSNEAFHAWRKRVKDLWYHLRLLKNTWPPLVAETAEMQSRLADYLGDDHDLSVLQEALVREPAAFGDATEVEALLALAKERSEQLRNEAKYLAARLYAETPDAFTERYGAYYRVWHNEQPMVTSGAASHGD